LKVSTKTRGDREAQDQSDGHQKHSFADNKLDRVPILADELVRLKVDVLITPGTPGALALKKATQTIPIIFTDVTDPVATGLVDSLARPGGNLTGLTSVEALLAGKRLELLKETVGKLLRVAVLWDPQNSSSMQEWKESQIAARHLGLQLHSMAVRSADKYESAFKRGGESAQRCSCCVLDPAGGFESRADCRSGGKKSAASDLCSGQFR